MLGSFFSKWQRRATAVDAENQHLVSVAVDAMLERFSDNLRNLSEEAKLKKINEIAEIAGSVARSESRILSLRSQLCNFMLAMCSFEVLIHVRHDAFGKPMPLAENPAVSGELYRHISLIRKTDSSIKEMAFVLGEPDDVKLLAAIQLEYEIYHAYVSAINAMRLQLGDFHSDPSRDWLKPFRESMLVWYEDVYRQKVGLPCLVTSLEAVRYSVFKDIVERGVRFPNLEWNSINS